MPSKRGLVLNPKDNVAHALEEVLPGQEIEMTVGKEKISFPAEETIPFGFKVAMTDIARGEPVVKYGEMIGRASRAIRKGDLVHIHNVEGARGRGDLRKANR
jgi:altronate dehydratase small subunit